MFIRLLVCKYALLLKADVITVSPYWIQCIIIISLGIYLATDIQHHTSALFLNLNWALIFMFLDVKFTRKTIYSKLSVALMFCGIRSWRRTKEASSVYASDILFLCRLGSKACLKRKELRDQNLFTPGAKPLPRPLGPLCLWLKWGFCHVKKDARDRRERKNSGSQESDRSAACLAYFLSSAPD